MDLGHPEACANRPGPTYPPQCVTCSRFVNVKTARQIPEHGDYGALLNVEFECARCVAAASQRTRRPVNGESP